MTNEEKLEAAKARIAASKAMLEEMKKTSAAKHAAENDTSKMGVQERLEHIGSRPEDSTAKPVAKRPNESMGIDRLTREIDRNRTEREQVGLDPRQPINPKHEELGKSKDGNKQENETGQNKEQEKSSEAKKQELAAKIKLPSGMEIHQEGPAWVIVSKDGKQRNDITDAMNSIEKYNHTVEEANSTAEAQNKVEDASSKAVDQNNSLQQGNAEASLTQGAEDDSIMQTTSEVSDIRDVKISDVAQALPEYKDFDFAQEDLQAIATFAIDHFTEKELTETLQNSKEENDRKADKRKQFENSLAMKKMIEQQRAKS